MKNIISAILAGGLLLTGCYGEYVMDYDYSGVYSAYQYDLRTFVVGEGMKIDYTVALAGVVSNDRDRMVEVGIDDALVTEDLSGICPEAAAKPFTALDGLKGNAPFGMVSQSYVPKSFSKIGSIAPLPSEYYTVEGLDGLAIRKGRHTAAVTIKATQEALSDARMFEPYYAIGFNIKSADADTVPQEHSFEVIAVKCESRFYGNWYHGGKTLVRNDVTGEVISEYDYPLTVPQAESNLYILATVDANTVKTDRMEGHEGCLFLTFDGNDITISCSDAGLTLNPIQGYPNLFNGAPLLQDRRIALNYCFSNGDGTTTYVYDELLFRNRIRDGINEWQDENTGNYEK